MLIKIINYSVSYKTMQYDAHFDIRLLLGMLNFIHRTNFLRSLYR